MLGAELVASGHRHHSADTIAVARRAHEPENGARCSFLLRMATVVAEESGWCVAVVEGEVVIAVIVEVDGGYPPSLVLGDEIRAEVVAGGLAKPAALVVEEEGKLLEQCIVAGLVPVVTDMAVGDHRIVPTIEVEVGELDPPAHVRQAR